MSTCKRIKIDKNKVCDGDRRHPISILSRSIVGANIGDLSATEAFTLVDRPIAAIITTGSVGATGSGGVGPYTYNWDGGLGSGS